MNSESRSGHNSYMIEYFLKNTSEASKYLIIALIFIISWVLPVFELQLHLQAISLYLLFLPIIVVGVTAIFTEIKPISIGLISIFASLITTVIICVDTQNLINQGKLPDCGCGGSSATTTLLALIFTAFILSTGATIIGGIGRRFLFRKERHDEGSMES